MVAPKFQIVSHTDIAPEVWDEIAPRDGRSPKLLHDWADAMAEAYSRGGALRVVVAGPLTRPDAILPLGIAPGPLQRHFYIANDDGGLPAPSRDDAALADLAAGLIRLGKPVDLGYFPANSPLIGEIRRAARGRAMVMLKPQEIPAAPWMDLDPSWAEPFDHMRRNLRQSIRRNGRRLAEQGAVEVAYVEPAEHEVDALLDAAVEVEAKSWKDRTGTAMVHDQRQREFFRIYARKAARAGRMHFALLKLDGTPIAMSIGEIYDGIFWAYKIGYDEAYAKVGPGVLLQYHMTSHLAVRGITRIEFQGQLVDYKRNWTDQAVETVALRVYPFAPRGIAAIVNDAVTQMRKRREARKLAAAKGPRPAAAPAPAAKSAE